MIERLQDERQAQQRGMPDQLDAVDDELDVGGPPPIVLPPVIARCVLKDVQSGMRLAAIARKYQPFHPFSRAWLRYAIAAGRLERMARGLSLATA